MKNTSPVQKVVTWAVIFLLVILGISVLVKKDTGTPYDRPNPVIATSPDAGPTPFPVYPNNGKE